VPATPQASRVLRDDLGSLIGWPAVELVGRYRPAVRSDQVGGDWYDAFPLPDGTYALVIGDVAGHDAEAAVRMTQMRAAVRALAYDRPEEPNHVLRRLDELVCGLEFAEMATVTYAVLEPASDRSVWSVRWSSAGHPPPLAVGRHGTAAYLPQQGGIVIGITPHADRPVNARLLPAGCSVVFHTDGLVEHRGRDIDDGMRAAERSAGRVGTAPLPVVCDALMDCCPDSEDDVAVLGVRLTPVPGAG
jgi:serine phosphatase RsbU (regulator of sigma subunit)